MTTKRKSGKTTKLVGDPKVAEEMKEFHDSVRKVFGGSVDDDMIYRKTPFTRFERPDGIEIIKYHKAFDSVVVYKNAEIYMLCCEDLASAKKLRTELIKSLELLDFYIDQVEESGEIRYVR